MTASRHLFGSYYRINRATYRLGPLAAAWDAFKLTLRIRGIKEP